MKFEYCDQKYNIKSVEALKTVNVKEYVLLITCAFYVEIYRQLRDIPEIADLECYMYNAVCSYPELDVERFFTKEIEKRPYKEWKAVLQDLHLRDIHKGQRCFIIGNGPSLRLEDIERLKGEVTFGANRIFKLFDKTDWRPTYYVCIDYLMYGLDHREINEIDSKIKFVPLERALAAGEIITNCPSTSIIPLLGRLMYGYNSPSAFSAGNNLASRSNCTNCIFRKSSCGISFTSTLPIYPPKFDIKP